MASSTPRPYARLKAKTRDQPSKAKVGQWLQQAAQSEDVDDDELEEEGAARNMSSVGSGSDDGYDVEVNGGGGVSNGEFSLDRFVSNATRGKPGQRTKYLRDEFRIAAGQPPAENAMEVVDVLLDQLPRTTYQPLLDAIVATLCGLIAREQEDAVSNGGSTTDAIVRFLETVTSDLGSPSRTVAPSTLLPYLILANESFSLLSRQAVTATTSLTDSSRLQSLLLSNARALNVILSDPSEFAPEEAASDSKRRGKIGAGAAKATIRKGAITRCRRMLRNRHTLLPDALDQLLRQSETFALPLLGVAVGVALRLRGDKQSEAGQGWVANRKQAILKLYLSMVLSSKTPVASHTIASIDDLWVSLTTEADFGDEILPMADKMLVRSPEIALPVLAYIFATSTVSLAKFVPSHVIPGLVSASKSSKIGTRQTAIDCASTLAKRLDASSAAATATELLKLPITGKTTSADNRACLFAMLPALPASAGTSALIVKSLVPLIAKETNETALVALVSALALHLRFCLEHESSEPAKPSITAIAKEATSNKALNKRQIFLLVGRAYWQSSKLSPLALELADALVPAFEVALKATQTAATANAPMPFEAYVATALAVGPLADSPKISQLCKSNPVLSAISVAKPKPSFLLLERNNRKVLEAESDRDTKIWMLRAVQSVASTALEGKVEKSLRLAIGTALVTAIVEQNDSATRIEATNALKALAAVDASRLAKIIVDSLEYWMSERIESTDHGKHVHLMLRTVVQQVAEGHSDGVESLLEDLLLVAHHPLAQAAVGQSWIEIVQSVKIDPAVLIQSRQESVLAQVRSGWSADDPTIRRSAYNAIQSLVIIAPHTYVPVFLEQATHDLDMQQLTDVGEEEIGIWKHPEGSLFVDVLNKKTDGAIDKNSKTYQQDKWDKEVRESIAAKKKASAKGGLSKADQALVDAQLKTESATRAKVRSIQVAMSRGIEILGSLLSGRSDEFDRHLGQVQELLAVLTIDRAADLVGEQAIALYLELSSVCAPVESSTSRFIGVASLRALGATLDADMTAEPLADQVTRLLHRLHTIVSQALPEPPAVVYVLPLLSSVISSGGVGLSSEHREEILEQLTLVIDVYEAIASGMSNPEYPRLTVIRDLLAAASAYPTMAKSALSALTDVGAAIKDVATSQEIDALLHGLVSSDSRVRNGVLSAIEPVDLTELRFPVELYVARFDDDEPNANLADAIWEDNGLDTPEDWQKTLLPLLESDAMGSACARAIADASAAYPEQVDSVLAALRELYAAKAQVLGPQYDRFGMIIAESVGRKDPAQVRVAIAQSFASLSPLLTPKQVTSLFEFLVIEEALGDQADSARQALLAAAVKIVEEHGSKVMASLMSMFETYLAAEQTAVGDQVRQAVVILYGTLASHLPAGDKRLPKVIEDLVKALNTKSELVQEAVAECLAPLMKVMPDAALDLAERLLDTLLGASSFAEQAGAAYGLAGVVKGRGLALLAEADVMPRLHEAAADKKNPNARSGAVLAYRTLSAALGRAFEPYIISIIPTLLTLYGDSNPDVRQDTADASKVIMSKISGHCVKTILPLLLEGLEEKQWRTKKGSIELLGAMAFCAPKQLSISLPTIIPHLTGVITDSHAQVSAAAKSSLKTFGEVLNNPEIKKMQPILLKALSDPTTKTNAALSSLLGTSFEHYIDSPSLALVVPILDRGLKDRSSETKKKSAQIVGNMASLTESRDFVPYLGELLPLVLTVLSDAVPEARATAAKALGTLVERLGEDNFPSLVSSLLQTLRSDTGTADRQGAAQGLSEVLSGLGMARMEGLLPDIVTNASSSRSYVREGFISLLVYLPATFGQRFAPHLARIIPPVLGGLADESEFVRDASMRAGKMIIANYSGRAIELLLPELERGMLETAWRIRLSSISLTGELLYKITGISGKVEIEEEEAAPAQHSDATRKALLEALGADGRDRVLAILYIVRQDAVAQVRQASIHIWKALVHNTPRTTREILPTLVSTILRLLGSDADEQQQTASRTLGELCRKNGERILADVMPMLKNAIMSDEPKTREGACLAFTEIMQTASEDHLEAHESTIVSAVRVALIDPSAAVRMAAAQTFDIMQEQMGSKAIDEIIPTLLEAMSGAGESSETALMALREVMSVRANTVFPTLLPTLTAQPMTAFNARALGSLVSVAGNALSKRLPTVLGALVKTLEHETEDEEVLDEVNNAVRALLGAIGDSEGLHSLQMLLLGWAKEPDAQRRSRACDFLAIFCQVSQMDASDYRVDWVRQLVAMFEDPKESVVDSAWAAMDALVKSVDKDELDGLVVPLRRGLESLGQKTKYVPGLSRPKGAQPIVPILLAGLLSGTQEQKEQAAYGIGDLVQHTSEAAIKPFIIQLTGPLIRVISAGNITPAIKGAILSTLTVLLEEVPALVRPFHPQLTRTMVKSASDPSSLSVRNRAVAGLGELVKHQPRVDPLVTELLTAVRQSESDIAPSVCEALAAICKSATKTIGPAARSSILEFVEEKFEGKVSEPYAAGIGKILGGLALNDAEIARQVVE